MRNRAVSCKVGVGGGEGAVDRIHKADSANWMPAGAGITAIRDLLDDAKAIF